jgi:hypothetical protein
MNSAAFLFSLAIVAQAAAGKTLLFVDDHEVLYRPGARAVVHPLEKFTGNPVVTPDNPERPWEKSIQWVSVYRDPKTGRMQMWYQAFANKEAKDKRFKSTVAHAESDDGITWVKPELTMVPYKDRGFDLPTSNIVLIGAANGYGDRYANSVVVNPDERDPAKKYKMAYYDWNPGAGEEGVAGLCVAFSPDGIHWTKQGGGVLQATTFGAKTIQPPFEDEGAYYHLKNPDGREWRQWRYPMSLSDAVDALWDARLGRYVIYAKMWIGGPDGGINWKHAMGRSESEDFLHWSKPQLVAYLDESDPWNLEFHTSPVFIRHGVYFSLNQLFTRENGTIDNELMTSRDGLRWNRTFARQSVIPRGGAKAFDASFLLTNGTPIEMGDETWFYYGGNRGIVRFPNPDEPDMPKRTTEFGSGVGIAKMKRDRFVGIAPDPRAALRNWNPNDPNRKPEPRENTIGQITLKPRDLSRVKGITVNADAGKGAVRVEVLDENGYRLRGFTKDDAIPLTADALAQPVRWRDKQLTDLPPGRTMLRIHLDRAELFAVTLK